MCPSVAGPGAAGLAGDLVVLAGRLAALAGLLAALVGLGGLVASLVVHGGLGGLAGCDVGGWAAHPPLFANQ